MSLLDDENILMDKTGLYLMLNKNFPDKEKDLIKHNSYTFSYTWKHPLLTKYMPELTKEIKTDRGKIVNKHRPVLKVEVYIYKNNRIYEINAYQRFLTGICYLGTIKKTSFKEAINSAYNTMLNCKQYVLKRIENNELA